MYKLVGADQKEYGPVSEAQLNAWILEGRANAQTMVQAEGSVEWRPLGSFPEFAGVLGAKYPPPLPGQPGQPGPGRSGEEILAGSPQVRIGECLGRAWRLLLAHPGTLLGAGLLLCLIRLAMALVPFAGQMAYFVLFGVFYGGFYLMVLRRVRGQPGGVADMFAGFGPDFVPLLLVGMVSQVLTFFGMMLCLLPGIYLAVAWKFGFVLVTDRRLPFWPAMELSRRVITRCWFEVLALLVVAYLPVILFAFYGGIRMFGEMFPVLSRGGQMDFAEVYRLMKAGASLGLGQMLLQGLVLPFAVAALMYAYEDIFNTRPAPAA